MHLRSSCVLNKISVLENEHGDKISKDGTATQTRGNVFEEMR